MAWNMVQGPIKESFFVLQAFQYNFLHALCNTP